MLIQQSIECDDVPPDELAGVEAIKAHWDCLISGSVEMSKEDKVECSLNATSETGRYKV